MGGVRLRRLAGWWDARCPGHSHARPYHRRTSEDRAVQMMADDLARRVRDYARGQGRAAVNVSSAWLAREFAVDPRTVAAALRPYGIRPAAVEPGVRGYVMAELAAIRFDDEVMHPVEMFEPDWPGIPEPDAVQLLSAGAGHDMTPALKAAGLL